MTNPSSTLLKDTTLDYLIKTRSHLQNPLNSIVEHIKQRMVENYQPSVEKRRSDSFNYLIDIGFSHSLSSFILKEAEEAHLSRFKGWFSESESGEKNGYDNR